MGTETELKFRIPPRRLAALRRAVATPRAAVLALEAAYFDTPGRHLAAARMALRLRREGDTWVQTLKAEGPGTLQRLEHNVQLPAPAGRAGPVLDIARHDGSPAGAALRRLLAEAGAGQPLQQRYATAVQRCHRLLRSGGAVIELALDAGQVSAGARTRPLCEIEFELLQGPPQALLATAGRWAARHGLLLDVRSKSELGHTLAEGWPGSPPAPPPAPGARLAQALRPVLASASQLAAGPGTPVHLQHLLHSLAVLQAALAEPGVSRLPGAPAAALVLQALGAGLAGAAPAAAMGAVGAAGVAGVPDAAGAAGVPGASAWSDPPSAAAQRLLCRAATQQLWLCLIGLALADAAAPPA